MAEDRKFKFESGRFVNRVSGEAIPDDEPVMIFRARDRHALAAIVFYRQLVEDPHNRQAVTNQINEFHAYQQAHPERMKEPGITRDIALTNCNREWRLLQAVLYARKVFLDYAEVHEAKGTEDGQLKAQANRERAKVMEEAVNTTILGIDYSKAETTIIIGHHDGGKIYVEDELHIPMGQARLPMIGTGFGGRPKLYPGDWKNLNLSQLDRVAAHRAEFNTSLRAAVDAVRGEEQTQMEARRAAQTSVMGYCAICGDPQIPSPSGVTCQNGHGGAEQVSGECSDCKNYVGECPTCHRPRPAPADIAQEAGQALEQLHPFGYRSEDNEP